MKFILVRHGQTRWNVERRFCGHTDIPLNKIGVKQAENSALKLKDIEIDKVYTSDLTRAVETAEALMLYHDLPLIKKESLREMYFGKWEGLTYSEIQKNYPMESAVWIDDYMNVPSLEGESLIEFYNRIGDAFTEIKREVGDQDTVLLIAHAGVIQSILTREIVGQASGYWHFKVDNGGIAILDFDGEYPILSALNM